MHGDIVCVQAVDVPEGYLLPVADEELGPGVDVGDEEGEHDVDGEEEVDDDVRHLQPALGGRVHEGHLEQVHPRRVRHHDHHQRIPPSEDA